MRRYVLPANPVLMALVAARGGGGDGFVTPAQTPVTLNSASLKLSYTRPQ